ncbi:MAG: hypothetical protein IJB50_01010 [Clostridia bacterium]|nr:hypothetical protein [Clostridia bacterium]
MHLSFRLMGLLAGVFAAGLFAGLLLPPVWLVIMQGLLLIFIALCILCG